MASNILTKSKSIKNVFYAPNMRSLVAKLRLISRSMASITMQNSINTGSVVPTSGWQHDPNFPLPGNMNIDVSMLDCSESKSPEKYQSLASVLLHTRNDTFRKYHIVNQFLNESSEGDVVAIASSLSVTNKVECKIQECPATMRKDFQSLFSDTPDLSNLTVITISQETDNDMAVWSEKVEEERETLTGLFIENAKEVCRKIQDCGYWADFIDPASGLAFNSGNQNRTLFETDDRFNQLGFDVEDLGCCKVLMHKQWKSNVFVGVIFTNAPVESHLFADM